jgi:hypothetical protein
MEMSVHVVRVFTRSRAMLASNAQLPRKLDALERSVAAMDADTKHQFNDGEIGRMKRAGLMTPETCCRPVALAHNGMP